ncbi:TlpA family protein disulfide reductase [Haloglycomyces albus]|uniref:TlpA family protein disulfide reductase n=1 Tax=Haloglycomyces albus TaxID=526067 RepID=UPI00046D5C58|nr:redoxin domain-containing protein [Haloglycomyces albus]
MTTRSRLFSKSLAFALTAMFALSACGGGEAESPDSSAEENDRSSSSDTGSSDAPAPTVEAYDFTATTVDGEEFDGAQLQGSPTVLWFWASWCPKCRAQGPDVRQLHSDHGDSIDIVGIAGLNSGNDMQDFIDSTDTGDVTHLDDDAGDLWVKFDVTSQSEYVVLDADGEVVDSGTLSGEELDSSVSDLY